MKDSVLVEVRGAVGILTLNRPQILNAWNAPMRSRLVEGLDEPKRTRPCGPSS